MNPHRKTKIICTIGPATNSYAMLMKMYKAGMNVVRLNMSHGTHESHLEVIKHVRNINKKIKDAIPILLDTQGPEIRTGNLKTDLKLNEGDIITVSVRADEVEQTSLHINYADLIKQVKEGDKITVDSGLINLKVLKKNKEGRMKCRVIDGGTMKSKRHVNLPGIRVNLPAITDKDKKDIEFGIRNKIDYIALSFVREAKDVLELKKLLGTNAEKIKIISKIEDQEGVSNIEEIVDVSDGVMVARGDLGIEINIEELPNIQRIIVGKCLEKGKRIVVATHFLESMIENTIPTRAEVTDVANAVYEEVDAVMLSGETTVGKYPVRSIKNIDKISRKAEQLTSLEFSKRLIKTEVKQHIAWSAVDLAESINARGIVVVTKRGVMAQLVTNCRPQKTPIYALTFDNRTRRQLYLNRGVFAHKIERSKKPEETVQNALDTLKRKEGLKKGDQVVLVSDVITRNDIDAIQIRTIS